MANMKPADAVQDKQAVETIETLVDRYSLANVVEVLVAICGEKASHVREAWQDESLARGWDKDATTLDRIVSKLRNAG